MSGFLGDAEGEFPQVWLVPIESKFWSNYPSQANLAAPLSSGDLRNSYLIEESIGSAYAMLDMDNTLEGLPLKGNIGVRIAQTEQTSSGHASVAGVTTPVSMEVAYQQVFDQLPAPFDGLGLQANYTWTDSSAVYVDNASSVKGELEDVAKNSYNLTAFSEKDGLGVRASF